MTIVIDLTPAQEARLHEKAAQQGKEVGPYLVDKALQETEPDEWLRLLYSIGVPGTIMSAEATRRESLYEDHD